MIKINVRLLVVYLAFTSLCMASEGFSDLGKVGGDEEDIVTASRSFGTDTGRSSVYASSAGTSEREAVFDKKSLRVSVRSCCCYDMPAPMLDVLYAARSKKKYGGDDAVIMQVIGYVQKLKKRNDGQIVILAGFRRVETLLDELLRKEIEKTSRVHGALVTEYRDAGEVITEGK